MTLDQILYHSGKEARQDFTEGSPDERGIQQQIR